VFCKIEEENALNIFSMDVQSLASYGVQYSTRQGLIRLPLQVVVDPDKQQPSKSGEEHIYGPRKMVRPVLRNEYKIMDRLILKIKTSRGRFSINTSVNAG
jgi:hypothetical protein